MNNNLYKIIIKVPIVINTPPKTVLTVRASFKITKANIMVITTLNLSIGTTFAASPI